MKFNWSIMRPGAAPQYVTCAAIPSITKLQGLVVRESPIRPAGEPLFNAGSFGPKPFPQSVHAAPNLGPPPAHVKSAIPDIENAAGAVGRNVARTVLLAKPSCE